MTESKRFSLRTAGRYGSELLVVFVGVWLSLLAENWRQQRSDATIERASLRRIATDLGADLADLDFNRSRAEAGVVGGRAFVAGASTAGHGSMERDLTSLQFCSMFIENPGEYQALRNSGQLGVIRDEALRSTIVSHYESRSFLRMLHDDDCERTEKVFELLSAYVTLEEPSETRAALEIAEDGFPDTSRPRVAEVLDQAGVGRDPVLRNAVVTLVSRRRFLMQQISQTRASADSLRQELLSRVN